MVGKKRKPIKTFNERFLDRLLRLCGNEDIAISNSDMRKSLKWTDDRYNKVKASLLANNQIKLAQGPGGKVRFVNFPNKIEKRNSLNVFISYSHGDEEIKRELIKHLHPLSRLGMVESWDDRLIKAGEEWNGVISKKLELADIIILIISVDFINSNYCYDIEMRRAMERHEAGEARVIPVIARECLWHYAPFGKLQALPKDAKAVATWPDRDTALATVAANIYQVSEDLLGVGKP
ncbi:toll/interleukin-1 receptor domain-containing protein [Xanthobacter flavus]|uniref:toll/interleukin-1 receptor domain-containing protein n=1 Tax=Xanthobacter flavus TaxID=281 RepID=UPI003726A9CD